MAKPVSFRRPTKPKKGGSTSFNFGANVSKGGSKKGSVRRSQYATGGGS